jgi:hypothetical protein
MQEAQTRGLPGLAARDWANRRDPARLPLICFEAGRQTQTQSSVTASSTKTMPETANGCLVLRTAGTRPRGTTALLLNATISPSRLSRKSRWAPPSALLTLLIMDVRLDPTRRKVWLANKGRVHPLRFRSSGTIPHLRKSFRRLRALNIPLRAIESLTEAFFMRRDPSGWGKPLGN